MTKIDILVTLNLNRDFHKYWPKLKFFENFDQNEFFFSIIWLQSKFLKFSKTKNRIFENFVQNCKFSKISTQIDFIRQFDK